MSTNEHAQNYLRRLRRIQGSRLRGSKAIKGQRERCSGCGRVGFLCEHDKGVCGACHKEKQMTHERDEYLERQSKTIFVAAVLTLVWIVVLITFALK